MHEPVHELRLLLEHWICCRENIDLSDTDNAAKRLARIKLLAVALPTKGTENTVASCDACRRIALELVDLLKAEGAYQRTLSVPLPGQARPRLKVPIAARSSPRTQEIVHPARHGVR